MGAENNTDKKNKSKGYIGLIILIIIISAVVYLFIKTDIYAKIPGEDMSGSKYVGTWVTAGSGDHISGEPFEEFTPVNVSLITKEDVDKYRAEGTEAVKLDNGSMANMERMTLYDTGRVLRKVFKNNYKATWKETDFGVHYQPIIEGVYNPAIDFYATESINGVTPRDLGYSSDVFLIELSDLEAEELEEDMYCGYYIYAKE